MEDRRYVLAKFLGEIPEDVNPTDENVFTIGYGRYSSEYAVYTDEEADEAAKEYIRESLWAFNAWFLGNYTGLDDIIFEALSERFEDGNEAILSLVEKFGGLDGLVERACQEDGRGHFLSHYDGAENEFTYRRKTYYIYRMN